MEFDEAALSSVGLGFLPEWVPRFKVRQTLGFSRHRFTALVDLSFATGRDREGFAKRPEVERLLVVEQEGDALTCVLGLRVDLSGFEHFLQFDAFVSDARYAGGKLSVTVIGEQSVLKDLLGQLKELGAPFSVTKVNQPSFRKSKEKLLAALTSKQEAILKYASSRGYFEIPRRISTKDVAREFGITPAAVLEHLRKAIKKVFDALFA
ncbi:MAG: hypothetical protein Kow0069_31480 [Promethearchaeota archaeon]